MADNVAITAGSGTAIAADDIGSVWYQRVKLGLGADGTAVDAVAGAGVNGTGVQRVTLATDDSLLKAEDAAHTSTATGPFVLSLRADAAASSAGTDGDYASFNTDANGKLWVSGAFAEDAAATSADIGLSVLAVRRDAAAVGSGTDGDYSTVNVDATGKLWTTGTYVEDAAHTTGDKGVMALAVRSDVDTALAGTDLDYIPLATDSLGALKVVDRTRVVTFGVSGVPVQGLDFTTIRSVTDAPTAGQKIVIDEIVVGGTVAQQWTFTCETSGTVIAVLYTAAGQCVVWKPAGKIKLATADKKLQVTAVGSATTTCAVNVSYHSEA